MMGRHGRELVNAGVHHGGVGALVRALGAYLAAPKGTAISLMLGTTGPAEPYMVVMHIGEEKFCFTADEARVMAIMWETAPEALVGTGSSLQTMIDGVRMAADHADRENGVGATRQ
jgi:hypothetical protein